MDPRNLFLTRGTYNMLRLDHFIVLLGVVTLFLFHLQEVNWWRFAAAFAWPDVVGYLPGLYCYYTRREPKHRNVPSIFYTLYNVTHSITVNAGVIAVWYFLTGTWEWAMLALPIHLLGDRSLFGSIYKSSGLSFEPVSHPGFSRFLEEYNRGGVW